MVKKPPFKLCECDINKDGVFDIHDMSYIGLHIDEYGMEFLEFCGDHYGETIKPCEPELNIPTLILLLFIIIVGGWILSGVLVKHGR